MQHENVDKDPDLRKSNDLRPINKPWVPWVPVLLGALFAVALVVIAGWIGLKVFDLLPGTTSNTTDNASAAGAWASATGATALALASVWIAMQANKQAREAERRAAREADKAETRHHDAIDAAEKRLKSQLDAAEAQNERDLKAAEQRHARELGAAEKRLTDELNAQRRHQQLMTIAPVWAATTPFVETAKDLLKQYPLTVDMPKKHITHMKAKRLYHSWKETSIPISGAFVEPNLLISDPETRLKLSGVENACRKLRNLINTIQADLEESGVYNGPSVNAAYHQISEINKYTRETLKYARKNIAKVPALSEGESESLPDKQGK